MNKGSPFYVETYLGKLELTKGAYLTLQKRKSSTIRTLEKTKIIVKECSKPTVKRRLRNRCKKAQEGHQVLMVDCFGQQVSFKVEREAERLSNKMVGSLPSIEMSYDNDAESEWGEINGCVNNLSLSLSLTTFDHLFRKD